MSSGNIASLQRSRSAFESALDDARNSAERRIDALFVASHPSFGTSTSPVVYRSQKKNLIAGFLGLIKKLEQYKSGG